MKASITSPAFALFNTCMVGVIRGDRSREGAGVGSGNATGHRATHLISLLMIFDILSKVPSMFKQEMMVLSKNNHDYVHTFALLTLI